MQGCLVSGFVTDNNRTVNCDKDNEQQYDYNVPHQVAGQQLDLFGNQVESLTVKSDY